MFPETKKLPKGQFKCYHCRKIYPSKEGDWYHWNTMQVHLCNVCAKQTQDNPERK